MKDRKIPKEKAKRQIDIIDDAKDILREINQSEINLNYSRVVGDLDAKKKEIEERMEKEETVFFENEAESAFNEFCALNNLNTEETRKAVQYAIDEIEEIVRLYDLYIERTEGKSLSKTPDKRNKKDQLEDYLKNKI